MPRRGSRLIFKPSSILVAVPSMPDLVTLDNNFPHQSRPFPTCCTFGATLPKRRLFPVESRISLVQIPDGDGSRSLALQPQRSQVGSPGPCTGPSAGSIIPVVERTEG